MVRVRVRVTVTVRVRVTVTVRGSEPIDGLEHGLDHGPVKVRGTTPMDNPQRTGLHAQLMHNHNPYCTPMDNPQRVKMRQRGNNLEGRCLAHGQG